MVSEPSSTSSSSTAADPSSSSAGALPDSAPVLAAPPVSHTSSAVPMPTSSATFGSPPTIGEKLTGRNYPIWKAQILPYLEATWLLPVLDGSEPSPLAHLFLDTGAPTPNPAYNSWKIRDSIAMGWILNSSTSPVVAQLTRHTSAAAIWKYLSDSYAAQSSARAFALRLQLQSMTKGNCTVTDYLQEVTSLTDQLSAIGESFFANEYHTHLFRGLGAEFVALDTTVSVLSQTGALSRDALHGLLLQHEGRLELHTLTTAHAPPAAFAAQQPWSSPLRTAPSRHTPPNGLLPTPPPTYSSFGGRGRGRRFTNSPFCQICRRQGHRADHYRERFNNNFVLPLPSSRLPLLRGILQHRWSTMRRLPNRPLLLIRPLGILIRVPPTISRTALSGSRKLLPTAVLNS